MSIIAKCCLFVVGVPIRAVIEDNQVGEEGTVSICGLPRGDKGLGGRLLI